MHKPSARDGKDGGFFKYIVEIYLCCRLAAFCFVSNKVHIYSGAIF